ncbi:hypothetical protein SLOPH_1822, partial [Spraguea lophii 42_110]
MQTYFFIDTKNFNRYKTKYNSYIKMTNSILLYGNGANEFIESYYTKEYDLHNGSKYHNIMVLDAREVLDPKLLVGSYTIDGGQLEENEGILITAIKGGKKFINNKINNNKSNITGNNTYNDNNINTNIINNTDINNTNINYDIESIFIIKNIHMNLPLLNFLQPLIYENKIENFKNKIFYNKKFKLILTSEIDIEGRYFKINVTNDYNNILYNGYNTNDNQNNDITDNNKLNDKLYDSNITDNDKLNNKNKNDSNINIIENKILIK